MTVAVNGTGVPSLIDASGAFETCRVKRGKVLRLGHHLDRLRASLKGIGLLQWDEREARGELIRSAAGLADGYLRIAVRRNDSPRVLVHRQERLPYTPQQARRGLSVTTVPSRMPQVEAVQGRVKSSERLSGIFARMEAPRADEVLRLSAHGYVTEGTVSNLFLVKAGELITAPAWSGVLEGITRAGVIRAARAMKVPVKETPFTRHDLFNAEEVFLTNVLMGVLPVREVDGRRIGGKLPGPLTRKLMRAMA